MSDDAPDLTDFGGGVSTEPPRVRKTTPIQIRVDGTTRTAGHVGRAYERPGWAFVTTRNSHAHRLRYYNKDDGGTYAISMSALSRVMHIGEDVQTVFVHEVDTGDVYEWPLTAFTTDGEVVPPKYLDTKADPQTGMARETATHVWEGHAPDDFYVAHEGDA